MIYKNMDEAIAFMLETTPGAEVIYRSDFYSCVATDTCKIHGTFDWKKKGISVTGETWDKGRDPAQPYHPFALKEIATLAFDRLRSEKKTDAALTLASALIKSQSITLGLGDTDWEIQSALEYCGYTPPTVSRYRALMSFEGTVKLPDYACRRLKAEFYD